MQNDQREAVARIIADHVSGGFDAALQDKQEWKDRSGLGYDCEPSDVNGPFKDDYLDAADAILALLSARPLALGGQHSTATDFPPDDVLACDTTPARAEAPSDDLRTACKAVLDDYQTSDAHHPDHVLIRRTDFDRIKALVEAPVVARAEAQDEGAAGVASAYRVRMVSDDPAEWVLMHPEKALDFLSRKGWESQPLYTHPSPTPAADADRVRIAVEALEVKINAPLTGPTHGAWDRGRIAGLKEALAALKSEGK